MTERMATQSGADQRLQSVILKHLDWAEHVGSRHVGVTVTGGAVVLSGTVDSQTEKDAAFDAAFADRRVSAVVDRMNVVAPLPEKDVEVARAAAQVVTGLRLDPATRIKAVVRNGELTLRGRVACEADRRSARTAAAGLAGVTEVHDHLIGIPTPLRADVDASVRAALERCVRKEEQHLHIAVDGHVATLRGAVHSAYESRAAERAAADVPGVMTVVNALTIAS